MFAVTPCAESSKAADIVKFSNAALAAPYDTSSGKPSGPPEVNPMILPHMPPRAICRLENSAIKSAAACASTAKTLSIVPFETGCTDRPNRSVETALKVSATYPLALLMRMSTGPNRFSAVSNNIVGVSSSARSASSA